MHRDELLRLYSTSQRDFRDAELASVDLREETLTKVDLSYANLNQANLSRANLYGAIFKRTQLSAAKLYGANLRQTDFTRAELQGANLRSADLKRAIVTEANLSNTDLRGANLRSVVDLSTGIWKDAIYDEFTEFPEGFDPQILGMKLGADLSPPSGELQQQLRQGQAQLQQVQAQLNQSQMQLQTEQQQRKAAEQRLSQLLPALQEAQSQLNAERKQRQEFEQKFQQALAALNVVQQQKAVPTQGQAKSTPTVQPVQTKSESADVVPDLLKSVWQIGSDAVKSALQSETPVASLISSLGLSQNPSQLMGQSFTEELVTAHNEIVNLEMVYIQAGSFQMGSPDGEGVDREWPQHPVTVPAFYLGKYPVTQAQYEAVMGQNPSLFKGRNLPVEQVSWNEAVAFCQKLSEMSGRTYRLPSEAEWEYACRAGATTRYYFGDDESKLGDYAWYSKNSGNQTHPVGEKKPNVWGLYDMHGNVWEWCQDCFYGSYQGAPMDNRAWLRGNDNHSRILRGGSWYYDPRFCRSAYRFIHSAGSRLDIYGVRLVYSSATALL